MINSLLRLSTMAPGRIRRWEFMSKLKISRDLMFHKTAQEHRTSIISI